MCKSWSRALFLAVPVLASCLGCAARPGQDGRGGMTAFLAGFFVSRDAGYGLNEGCDVSFSEGLRAVPYVAYAVDAVQGFAASSGRTRSEVMYERDLLPSTHGGFALEILGVAQQESMVSDADFQTYGKLVGTGSHLSFDAIRRASEMKLLDEAGRRQAIAAVVKPGGRLTGVILDVNPENRGLFSAAFELGVLTPADVRQLMAARLRRPDYLCTETVFLATRARVLTPQVRRACLDYILCRTQMRILDEARRAGKAPADADARMEQLGRRKAELRSLLKDSAGQLPRA